MSDAIIILASEVDPEPGIDIVRDTGLFEVLAKTNPGPFGPSSHGIAALEALARATSLGIAGADALTGSIRADLARAGSFAVPELSDVHHRLVGAFQIAVTTETFIADVEAPVVDGALDPDGLLDLLARPGSVLAARAIELACAYVKIHPGADGVTSIAAYLLLLNRAVVSLVQSGATRPFVDALATRTVDIGGVRLRGLTPVRSAEPSGLLPSQPEDIVGNDDYLQAGLRLARDVAGYDFGRRMNPKYVNPVLFGLGKPGCGKTVTAHAVGNYFLDYCRARGVAAKVVVVRRTDWASTYQNASALNLVKMFRDQVYAFDGVCGVYWPDIDTAFASRDSGQLRSEEKQNLAAVFGIFDGTLLPRDGKWFLICDANTMHMDEATISRISQNPFNVGGPATRDDYVRLMRDVLLRNVQQHIRCDDNAWATLGDDAARRNLSGRNVEAICRNAMTRIFDFEYPDEYFTASSEQRQGIVDGLCRPIGGDDIQAMIDAFDQFLREAELDAAEDRFTREVESIVRQLNASRAAALITES